MRLKSARLAFFIDSKVFGILQAEYFLRSREQNPLPGFRFVINCFFLFSYLYPCVDARHPRATLFAAKAHDTNEKPRLVLFSLQNGLTCEMVLKVKCGLAQNVQPG